MDGWVRDSEHGLIYWAPHDIRTGLHSPALLTIPFTSRIRFDSVDFDDFARLPLSGSCVVVWWLGVDTTSFREQENQNESWFRERVLYISPETG